jgi:HAMP domain-containing protein
LVACQRGRAGSVPPREPQLPLKIPNPFTAPQLYGSKAGLSIYIDTGYSQRKDEIGALAGALDTFKQQAVDKARIETQERERNAGATARQKTIESYVGEFENLVRQTLDQLGDASGQMRTTSAGLSAVSRQPPPFSNRVLRRRKSRAARNMRHRAPRTSPTT